MRFEATTLDTVGVEVVLVDDGGVISDNERRAPEWQRLIGEYLSPRLGGAQEKWALANRTVVTPLWDEMFSEPLDGRPYLELYESYLVLWLARMCEAADVAMPPHNEALALAWETTRFVTTNVRAAFPGVADAVNALSAPGLVLHTASAGASWELEGYLSGAGIRERFQLLFGADLVGELKLAGRRYYENMFRLLEVDPSSALVVDDSPGALAQAAELGARTVLVRPDDAGLPGALGRVLSALDDEPASP